MNEKENQKNKEDPRLNILTLIIRLANESFARTDYKSKVNHILNNTRLISRYDRSCLVESRGASLNLAGISGEERVNQNSEYARGFREFFFPFLKNVKEITVLDDEFIGTLPESSKIKSLFEKYKANNPQNLSILIIPMFPKENPTDGYFWVLEYFSPAAESEKNKMGLLAQSYISSLCYGVSSGSINKVFFKKNRWGIGKSLLAALLVFLVLMVVYRVNLNVPSSFELVPSEYETLYAPFSGKIEDVMVKNGQKVKTGETLAQYDINELQFELSKAQITYRETIAKLDMLRQKSFSDETILPEIRILELQKDQDEVSIEKIKWFIDHSILKAQTDGVAVIDDEKHLKGKAVNAGEKLMEVVSNKNLIAEILLTETDAAVLEEITSITLYLHSRPEEGIRAELISASPKATFEENQRFCFIIKASFDQNTSSRNLVYGMRGIARVGGVKVSLGYYLFRNVLLWWRKF